MEKDDITLILRYHFKDSLEHISKNKPELVRYSDLDAKLKLPDGSSKNHLREVLAALNGIVHDETPSVIAISGQKIWSRGEACGPNG